MDDEIGNEILLVNYNSIPEAMLDIFIKCGELSVDAIKALAECSINSEDILKMMHAEDINEIFQARGLMSDRIKFRYNLRKWRKEHDYEPLTICGTDKTLSMVSHWLSQSSSLNPSTSSTTVTTVIKNIEEVSFPVKPFILSNITEPVIRF